MLRVLSVHLKSGCHGGNLENTTNPACLTLAAQRAPLEAWIDTAAQRLVPFAILGDFNRRIDQFGRDDHLWREIDDEDPPGLDLWSLPFNREAECNPSFPQPIDFLVFDDVPGRWWTRRRSFPSEGQLAHTDIHHLRPADVTCNSDRGNLDFDESEFAHPDCASRRDADSFEPRDAVKGDIARMLF